MLHPEVKDKPIVIVSVAGGFRNGKSFLLGFFFKYLETEEEAWLTADDVIKGFKWRGGCKRITSGIHIWSKPFIRVNECGQEIYNIMPQLQEDDLQHLERLLFLVRDWQHTCDYPYGLEGGNAYVKTKLQVKPNQPQELQRLRRNIHSAFQSIAGFLLPRPSEAVATQPTFSGRVKEVGGGFIKYIKQFVPYIMSKEVLVTKTIDHWDMTGKDSLEFVRTLINAMKNEEMSTPQSDFTASVEFEKNSAVKSAFDFYKKEMDEFSLSYDGQDLTEKILENRHRAIREQAREKLSKMPRIRISSDAFKCYEQLEDQITDRFRYLRTFIKE